MSGVRQRVISRRPFVTALGLAVLVSPFTASAQQARKVSRIGILLGASSGPSHPIEGFRERLRELGYVDGKNIVIEYRWADGRFDRFSDFAAELVHLNVDLIVASVTAAALAASTATTTIPIVGVLMYDPVAVGLAASFARPGGNVTGLTSVTGSEIYAKQLELLKEAVPQVSRVAVLVNPRNPTQAVQLRETDAAARSLHVQRLVLAARGPEDLDSAFVAMTKQHAGALVVLADPMFYAHRSRIADLASKHGTCPEKLDRFEVEDFASRGLG